MDKYELNIKIEQIKKLAKSKEYASAAKVADDIDFYKLKDNKILSLLADVYEASGNFSQAKEVLIEAYSRTSLGRRLAYRLVKICIKEGNVQEAEEFYQDFIEVAPRDNSRLILEYELAAAKGAPMHDRIQILTTYLQDEMDEKWAYELAKLYHKTGQKEKCIKQCDDIILWFSEGKYVDKAMELKMLYAPLTKSQQAKYEERWMAKAPSNINVEDIKVKEYDPSNQYNTVNIQKAIKESMDILMNEDNLPVTKEPDDMEKTKIAFREEAINSLLSHTVKNVTIPKELSNTAPIDPMYDVDTDGQMELNIDEPIDEQIAGQITIEELLKTYEERKNNEIGMETTRVFMPVIEEQYPILPSKENEAKTEEKTVPAEEPVEIPEPVEEEPVPDDKETVQEETPEPVEVPNQDEEADDFQTQRLYNTMDLNNIEIALEEAATAMALEGIPEDKCRQKELEETEPVPEEPEQKLSQHEDEIKNDSEPEENIGITEEAEKEAEIETELEESNSARKFINEFVDKYSGVQGLDNQLLVVLRETFVNGKNNIIVMGEMKSGKTALAIDLVKTINKLRQNRGRKIAKISAEALNGKNVSARLEKLTGMDLIIENAAMFREDTLEEFLNLIEDEDDQRIVVLEDEKSIMENMINTNSRLDKIFTNRVVMRQNKVRDWAAVAVDYAKELGYEIDEMGMLALHAQIDALYAISLVISKPQVVSIIDEAVNKNRKRGIGRVMLLLGKEKKKKILSEEDFN